MSTRGKTAFPSYLNSSCVPVPRAKAPHAQALDHIVHHTLPRPVETMYPRIRWRGHAGIITHRASRIMHHGPIAIESDELLLAESVPIVSEVMVMCPPQYEIREIRIES